MGCWGWGRYSAALAGWRDWSRIPEGRAEGDGREPPFALARLTGHSSGAGHKGVQRRGPAAGWRWRQGPRLGYVCEMLVQRSHSLSDENWGLVECHPYLALGVGPQGTA